MGSGFGMICMDKESTSGPMDGATLGVFKEIRNTDMACINTLKIASIKVSSKMVFNTVLDLLLQTITRKEKENGKKVSG